MATDNGDDADDNDDEDDGYRGRAMNL